MPGVDSPEAGFAAGLLIRTQFLCESPAFLNARVSHLALRAEVLYGGNARYDRLPCCKAFVLLTRGSRSDQSFAKKDRFSRELYKH